MAHETLLKFRYPDTLIREYRSWAVLLRPDQVTAGSLVLVCTLDAQRFSDVPPDAFSELGKIVGDIENTLSRALHYEKLNYLMLMMVDKQVHFHILPRYSGPCTFGGVNFIDGSWPGPPNLSQVTATTPAEFQTMLEELRADWPPLKLSDADTAPESRQPIPSDAQRVFRGALFDVYQWQQALFDGTRATFEKLRRPDTAYVLPVDQNGRITVVEQLQPGSRPFIGLVGGRLDGEETPQECARRELLEETGLEAGTLKLWSAFQFLPKIDWAIYVFIGHDCRVKGEPKPDAGEQLTQTHLSLDELIAIAAEERFGDVEIALLLLRTAQNPKALAELRRSIEAR